MDVLIVEPLDLQVTLRVSATTQQSRVRGAWALARRIDELLLSAPAPPVFRRTLPGEFADLEDGPATA